MNMNMRKLFIGLALLVAMAPSMAQRKVLADGIVGIVGDKIILRSDVFNEILDRQRRGEPVPENAPCAVLEQILIIKALTLQAEKDSIVVSDEEIEAALDNKVRGFIGMYGSKEALEEIAGRTVYQIKEDFRSSFKDMKLSDEMKKKVVENVKITPQEARAFWEKTPRDSLPFYESEVEVGEIIVYPKASPDFEKLSKDELADYKAQVEAGKSRFETLASLYTDDPGSKNTGGQYTINRNQKDWDPAFVNHAFRLKEGQVSPVFKSKFGYHIIQMVQRNGDDAVVRHILRIPKITETETNEAISKLDSVRSKLVASTINFGEATSKYSEDDNAKYFAGMKQGQNGSYLTIDQLDKDLVLLLGKMKVGEYSMPMVFTDERQKKGVRIIYLKTRTAPHRENLKDDYNRIAQRAIEQKKTLVMEKWFSNKIPSYYIMISDEFKTCPNLSTWWQYASRAAQ
jgi:peptidyl-prolyl cis-trans isomerase SurA